MTDKVYTLRAAGVDQRADVPNQFGHPVIPAACRSCAAGVTPLVRCETAIAPSGEFRDHGVPAGVHLRKAVQQDHDGSVGKAGIDDVEDKLPATVLIHS